MEPMTDEERRQRDNQAQDKLEATEAALLAWLLVSRRKAVNGALSRGQDPERALSLATRNALLTGRQWGREIARDALSDQFGASLRGVPNGGLTDAVRAHTIATRQARFTALKASAAEGTDRQRWRIALQQTDYRAATAAATEPWHAAGHERSESAKQVQSDLGLILEKRWNAERDKHTCVTCSSMHGEQVPIDRPFSGGLIPGGAHARCRCWEEIIEVGQRRAERPVAPVIPIRPTVTPRAPARPRPIVQARPRPSPLPLPGTEQGDAAFARAEAKRQAAAARSQAARARRQAAADRDRARRDAKIQAEAQARREAALKPAKPKPIPAKDYKAAGVDVKLPINDFRDRNRTLFGRELTPQEFRAMSGADAIGAKRLTISSSPDGIMVTAYTPKAKMIREFTTARGSTRVTHTLFELAKDAQGAGLGKRVLRDQIREYSKLGLKEVRLDAMWAGKYTWARMGFDVAPDVLAKMKAGLGELGYGGALKSINSVRDIALLEIDGIKVGKQFLLEYPGAISMRASLDPASKTYRNLAEYLGL